jgi:hypothetical protein
MTGLLIVYSMLGGVPPPEIAVTALSIDLFGLWAFGWLT